MLRHFCIFYGLIYVILIHSTKLKGNVHWPSQALNPWFLGPKINKSSSIFNRVCTYCLLHHTHWLLSHSILLPWQRIRSLSVDGSRPDGTVLYLVRISYRSWARQCIPFDVHLKLQSQRCQWKWFRNMVDVINGLHSAIQVKTFIIIFTPCLKTIKLQQIFMSQKCLKLSIIQIIWRNFLWWVHA